MAWWESFSGLMASKWLVSQAPDFAGWVLQQHLSGSKLSPAQNQAAQGITVAQGLGLKSPVPTQPAPTPAPPTPATPKRPRAKKTATATSQAAMPPVTQSPAQAVKVNQPLLDSKRDELVQKHGDTVITNAEANLKKVLANAGVYTQIERISTLEKIIDGGPKNAYEVGKTDHNIPDLKDKNYQVALKRVEELVLGMDKNTPASERPIYGFLGDPKQPKGAVHDLMAKEYGDISIKWKDSVKDNSTFTGSDSFKSGIASPVRDPNAASVVAFTRHGYEVNNLPSHYPGYLRTTDQRSGSNLRNATSAKSATALAGPLAPTGHAYMEVQIQKRPSASDIEAVHFGQNAPAPSQKVIDWANQTGVPVFVAGKQVAGPKPPQTPKTPKATQHPLVKLGITDTNNVNYQHYDRADYKPMMSKSEAQAYASQSVFKQDFHHGTYKSAAVTSITTQGVDINKNRVHVYGKGFYISDDSGEARGYGDKVIKGKIDIRRPLVVARDEWDSHQALKRDPEFQNLPKSFQRNDTTTHRKAAMRLGYDGVHIAHMKYFVIFNNQQFVAYEVN